MLGYLSVSIIHHMLTWTTGSLTCARGLVACVRHTGDLSWWSPVKDICRGCTQLVSSFSWRELSRPFLTYHRVAWQSLVLCQSELQARLCWSLRQSRLTADWLVDLQAVEEEWRWLKAFRNKIKMQKGLKGSLFLWEHKTCANFRDRKYT